MDFKLDKSHLLQQELFRRFAETEIKPLAKEMDEKEAYDLELLAKMQKYGFFGVPYSKEYGGAGSDTLGYTLCMEEVSKVDASTGITISVHTSLCCSCINNFGTEEQKQKYLRPLIDGSKIGCYGLTEPGAGSDVQGAQTTAVKDGDEWVINGEKCFITNGGEADIVCVFAATDPTAGAKGISAFMVPTSVPGFSVTKYEDKSGFRTISTCSLKFENVRVPASNLVGGEAGLGKGFSFAMKTLDKSRACVGALAVGIARRALDEAIAFVKERVTFGAPVAKRQGIQWMIADMATKIEASRCLVSHANDLQSKGLPFSTEAAMAKMFATQSAMEVCTDAIQLMGGKGYMKEDCVEKCFRDIKAYCIFEGTNQVQKMVISGAIMSGKRH